MLKGTIIGNLGNDAEPKTIGGKTRYTMNVAHSKKLPDGTFETTWVEVIINERPALLNHLTKGTKIYASGMLTCSAYYSDKEQKAKAAPTIWASDIEFCSVPPQQTQAIPSPTATSNAGDDNQPF